MLEEKVLAILEEVCETDEVKENKDIDLFDEGLLDSFGIVTLLVEIEEQLEVKVNISDFDRDEWATPNKIIQTLEKLA